MKVGLLGGTFDPIHEGHLAIAETVLKKFQLAQVAFIPCFQPPHRIQPIASPDDRLAMVTLAIKNHPQFVVDDIEFIRKGISYTFDTLQSLTEKNPQHHYFFIVGADAFAQFTSWHQWEKIVALADLVVVNRDNEKIVLPPDIPSQRIHFCNITPIQLSATQIRTAIADRKKNIPGLSPAVFDYITTHRIY